MCRLFQPVVSVQRRPSLYQATLIVRLPIVPRVNPHTVDESARSSFLGFLAVLVEVESALFLQLSHWSANRGCDRRWISPRITTQILVDRFGFCRGLNDDKALPIFTLPNLILPGMRRTLITFHWQRVTDMDSFSADINPCRDSVHENSGD